ncbi:cysteine hydrolase [Novosphingobium flavum]|uniref:Cysteine hydrolase n=1 Tax=Novosphingobium flavum TaxID=1778672 RepID=A0A7X1FRY6_9SPHN|nr:cysteine hydrolase [Novosphingobium flavum]MBC2665868.1 cysteine hydrolase [Novosphingobium flavum]
MKVHNPLFALGLVAAAASTSACAQGAGPAPSIPAAVTDVWSDIKIPAAPELVPATVDAKTSALLILDMYPTSCNATARPSCVPTIPRVRSLLDQARAKGMKVIYSAGYTSLNGPTDPVPELARRPEDGLVRGPADKFYSSDLEKLLKDGGITTVVVTGTSADGTVLYTASSAAIRGIKAVVPVDGMSSKDRFAELYTAWHLKNSTASVTRNVVVTRSDLITIR